MLCRIALGLWLGCRSGVWVIACQSVFPSESGRFFIPWCFQAMVFRLIWSLVAVWLVRSMPLGVVSQSETRWNRAEETEKTSSMWGERWVLKLFQVE